MKVEKLESKFYMFGNKGAMWNNEAHIAESGKFSGETLCGVPMLSSNHCRLNEVKEIGCTKCIEIYNNKSN